ncbi:MAG: sigma-70 family RNA polymerase sigma factor [Pseudomonadales bacterium]
MPTSSDEERRWSELMREAQQGDADAYTRLLTELSGAIARMLRGQFGDFPFIEDCVQESLIAVHQARHTWHAGKAFKPWLNALVKHKTIDLLRKQNRHRQAAYDTTETGDEAAPAKPAAAIEDLLTGARLLAQLDKPNRDALLYTKLVGLSVEDTAVQLDTTPAAVKQRVRRAIAKTRQLLASDV